MSNDRIGLRVGCPFYQGIVTTKRMACVQCESMDVNLGFDTSHLIRLESYRELRNYIELFCCDRFKSCPYYQAVMRSKYW